MKKISLSEYKNPIRYFRFLAILIKEKNKNIDDFFYDELDKTPSSFWKALNGNVRLSTANNLLKIICDYLGYKIPADEVIDELEEILNKVYYSIYYKLTTNFEEELILLNKLIEQNYIVFPIIKMFKILINLSILNSGKAINENEEDFKRISKYIPLFSEDLLVIYEFLDLSFKKQINEYVLNSDYKNEISYYTLSGKCLLSGHYSNAIKFALIAKNKFYENNNLKRIIHTNLNIMEYYNILKKYDESYLLTIQQFETLKSLNFSNCDQEYKKTIVHHIVSCIGLRKYNEAITYIESLKELNLNVIVLSIVCCFYSDFTINVLNLNSISNERKEKVTSVKELIDRYLTKRNIKDEQKILKMEILQSIKSLIVNPT